MNRKLFFVIIIVILTLTNVILFTNYYTSKVEGNDKLIQKVNEEKRK